MKATSEIGPFPFNLMAETKPVSEFNVRHLVLLDDSGNPSQELPLFAQSPDELITLYQVMTQIRILDKKAVSLQRTGQLGTYASSLGQEAVGVGIGSAMQADDILLPSYRDYGAMYWRGVEIRSILQYWSGDERGMDYEGACPNDFPITLTIGAQTTHSVGVAYALKLRGEGQAAVCSIGEGATSKGDFYEAINAAGVWKLPLVFFVTNNHYAISLHASGQTAAETFAQKSIAAGFPSLQIDGNDVLAVRHSLECALDSARNGAGPVLIEALTYRIHDHTTADDASRYRKRKEVEEAWNKDPIPRLRKYLESRGWWDESREAALIKDSRALVDREVEKYLKVKPADPVSLMFDHLYAELPKVMAPQRTFAEKNGKE